MYFEQGNVQSTIFDKQFSKIFITANKHSPSSQPLFKESNANKIIPFQKMGYDMNGKWQVLEVWWMGDDYSYYSFPV